MAQDDIQGQVVDGAGNPVSGAIVELTKSYQSSPLDEQVVRRTTTDANGNYIFEFHPDGDGTTQEWHVSCYNHDGTAYVNSFNNPGVTADLPSIAIPDSVLTQDLVAWYRFEDGDARDYTNDLSATFADSTAYDGVVDGATYQTSGGVTDFDVGVNSGQFAFDGTDDYISVSNDPLDSTQAFTLMGWFKWDGGGGTFQRMAGTNDNENGSALISVNQTSNTTTVRVGETNIATSLVSPGTYHHLCLTYDGGTAEGYLDNSSFGSASVSSSGDPLAFTIGRDNSSEYFSGDIDDVRIYNRALTSSEISDIYNETKP